MKITQFYLATLVLAALITLPTFRSEAQGLPARQNVYDLKSNQITTLKAAMQKIKSQPDIYTPLQYLHDGGTYNEVVYPGCMHGSEAFLSWHRQLMRDFEIALQNTGVPGAKDIMLPYWDWSQTFTDVPDGRYPEIAEDSSSPFYDRHRLTNANGSPVSTGDTTTALGETTWDAFGGNPSGPGALENPPHNNMHSRYVGGFLTNTNTAARDPLFWLFHAGIDYYWWKWQQNPNNANAQPANGGTQLKGFTNKTINDAWETAAMGYTYSDKKTQLHPGLSATVEESVAAAVERPMENYSFDVKIPRIGFKKAVLLITGVKAAGANTHLIDYYLYPANLEFSEDDPEFLKTYLAASISHFGTLPVEGVEHKHHPPTIDVRVNVTKALTRAAEEHAGETWKFTVVYEGVSHPETKKMMPVLLGQDVSHGPIYLVLE